jgi:DNA-3-methyladenine glycosylase I
MQRCDWVGQNPLMIKYHDTEWGVPLHNDQKLFEFMVLDAMQAGLSWQIVLKKRAAFKAAMDGFKIEKVAAYSEADLDHLMANPQIIRNRQKLTASITNAQKVEDVRQELGSLSIYLWGFTGGETVVNAWTDAAQIPAKSIEAEVMSRDLIARGFKFVGPTICYAFMQAAGMVNDHLVGCFRYQELTKNRHRFTSSG